MTNGVVDGARLPTRIEIKPVVTNHDRNGMIELQAGDRSPGDVEGDDR